MKVSELTAYERKRLNLSRTCLICGERIHDYDELIFQKRRDVRNVEYAFAHASCFKGGDLFKWQNEHQ